MTETNESEQVHSALQNAIHQIMNDNGEVASRWLTFIEVITAEGPMAMWTLYSEDMTPWEKLALVKYAEKKIEFQLNEYFATEYYSEEGDDDE